jgi:hypothetical protein
MTKDEFLALEVGEKIVFKPLNVLANKRYTYYNWVPSMNELSEGNHYMIVTQTMKEDVRLDNPRLCSVVRGEKSWSISLEMIDALKDENIYPLGRQLKVR